jgi:hypothetical protein
VVLLHEHHRNISSRAAVTSAGRAIMPVGQQQLRFAVAAFSSKAAAMQAAHELQTAGIIAGDISYLGLQTVLGFVPARLHALPFPGNTRPFACTEGVVAERVAQRLENGAQTLRAALATWLIPRHALQLERAVENGELLVWVQLCSTEDEGNAYRIMLSAGCTLVGVHDLVRS